MTFSHQQAADTLGVHVRTVGKVIAKYAKRTGSLPPGVDERHQLSEEFITWFNERPEARRYLYGHPGGNAYTEPRPPAGREAWRDPVPPPQKPLELNKDRIMSVNEPDAFRPRTCQVCHATFTAPARGGILSLGDNHTRICPSCRRAALDAAEGNAPAFEAPATHRGAASVSGAPMRQVVFDLETWGLDRGWGVTMIASFLIHGDPGGPKRITLRQRDSEAWKKGRRSDDHEIAAKVFDILKDCHIGYAHNGDRFDVKWLRTVALKYELDMPRLKLVDPCAIAWKKYLMGRNSLEAVADFLGVSEEKEGQKVHLSPDVWRGALMDDTDEAWNDLVIRCESDVEILNRIASRVTRDVGMVDYQGSWK